MRFRVLETSFCIGPTARFCVTRLDGGQQLVYYFTGDPNQGRFCFVGQIFAVRIQEAMPGAYTRTEAVPPRKQSAFDARPFDGIGDVDGIFSSGAHASHETTTDSRHGTPRFVHRFSLWSFAHMGNPQPSRRAIAANGSFNRFSFYRIRFDRFPLDRRADNWRNRNWRNCYWRNCHQRIAARFDFDFRFDPFPFHARFVCRRAFEYS